MLKIGLKTLYKHILTPIPRGGPCRGLGFVICYFVHLCTVFGLSYLKFRISRHQIVNTVIPQYSQFWYSRIFVGCNLFNSESHL